MFRLAREGASSTVIDAPDRSEAPPPAQSLGGASRVGPDVRNTWPTAIDTCSHFSYGLRHHRRSENVCKGRSHWYRRQEQGHV